MGKRQEVHESTTRYFDVLGTIWAVTEATIGWEESGNRNGHPDSWEPDDGETETLFTHLSLTRNGKTQDYTQQLEQAYTFIDKEKIHDGTGVLSLSILAACEALWHQTGSLGLLSDETDEKGSKTPFRPF